MNSDKDWKSMASQSSILAAARATQLIELLEVSKALLDKLPAHWHDDATVNLRDVISGIEKTMK